MSRQSSRTKAAERVVERLLIGVLILNRAGEVIWANSAADQFLSNSKFQLQWSPQELLACDKESFLCEVARRAHADGHSGISAAIQAGNGCNGFLHATVLEVQSGLDNVLVLFDPLETNFVSGRSLGEIYGLTPAELRVLAAFGQFQDTALMAQHLAVGENTIRAHLKSIYHKLGIKRQATLMHHLMSQPGRYLRE